MKNFTLLLFLLCTRSLAGFAQSSPGCSLTLTTQVSGCYSVSGLGKATVNTEISWASLPDQTVITARLGDQVKTITVRQTATDDAADVRSPQVVAFEVDADSAPGSVSVSYSSDNNACQQVSNFVAPPPCPPSVCVGFGGQVFNDFNADGIHEPGESTGLSAVLVRVITSQGQSLSTVTDMLGHYTLSVPTNAYPLRVEFSNLPSFVSNGTPNGKDGRTTVQFVAKPSCNIDLGILNPQDFCQTDPLVIVPCYLNGDPLASGSQAGPLDALVAFPYQLRGNKAPESMTELAVASQVGSLWGTAYNKFNRRLYSTAVLHRHVGLGPGGLGGVYVTDLSGPTASTANTSLLVNLADIGIDVGSVPNNSDRGLSGTLTDPSRDSEAFAKAGKVGIGDIDINEDGSLVWFTNLNDGKLYSLRVPANGAPTATDWAAHALPNNTLCTNGQRRIWGTKVYHGKVYIGTVCDASVSKEKSDLRAIVYAYTPGSNALGSNGTFELVFDFPLTYPKGAPNFTDPAIRGWFPWEDSFSTFNKGVDNLVIYPQPILSDIEFDVDGSMVLGFTDRSGLQLGYQNLNPNDPNDNALYSNISGGDLLRAYSSNGTFVLENEGHAGPSVGSSTSNNQGPGGGEFYNDDFYYGDNLIHAENAKGALAIRPGSGEVVATTMDPLDQQGWSGGIRYLSNSTGRYATGDNSSSAYVVYRTVEGDTGSLGKATGLGDVELGCNLPDFLQIGNRVWQDDDHDGEQDPNEKGIAGVSVFLYQNETLLTSTVTDEAGEYYFSYSPTSTTVPGATSALQPNTTYRIVFGSAGQAANELATEDGGRYKLTIPNATGGTLNDGNDSDAEIRQIDGRLAPTISVTTGAFGTVDHTHDAGFSCLPTSVAALSVTPATCPERSSVSNSDARIELTGIENATKAFLVTSSAVPAYTAVGGQPVSDSAVSFTGLSNPTATSGTSYSVVLYNGPCCYTVVSALLPQTVCRPCGIALMPGTPVCNTLTNEYTATATVSLTNAPASSLTVTDNGTLVTVFSVTAGQTSASFSLSGLSDASSHLLTVISSATTCPTESVTYTAPASCSVAPTLVLHKQVNKTKASLGDIVSYTLSVVNEGPGPAKEVVVSDQYTEGFDFSPESVTTSTGTFAPASDGGTWTIAYLPASMTATLIFSGTLTQEGILFNKASLPGQEAVVCTSVPYRVCEATPFALTLSAPVRSDSYQWYYTAPNATGSVPLANASAATYTATQPGAYKVELADGPLACPFYIAEVAVPTYSAQGGAPGCVGKTPQMNGTITLTGLGDNPGQYVYQVSPGGSIQPSAARPGTPTAVPANGLLANDLPEGTYTVRVWLKLGNEASCPRDTTVTLAANCPCPTSVCVPVTVQRIIVKKTP